jgi:alanine racemase
MSLRSRVVGVQQLQAGDTVGYGARFTAPGPMRIGVVACGYADGYLRSSGSVAPTPVLVDGQRTHVVGRVSMDLITVDLSNLPDCCMGSEVTLWGSSSQGHLLPIDEVAQSAGSIGYELMCALAARVPVDLVD